MKIGVLIDRLNFGGVEKIAIEEVAALRKINEDAHLLILRRKAVVEGAFSDLIKDIPVIYLDDRLPSLLRFSFKFPIFHFFSLFHITYPFFIPFILSRKEFDYIISHGTYTSFTAITIKKIRRIHFSAFIWDPISYLLSRVYSDSFLNIFLYFLHRLSKILDRVILSNTDTILVGGNAHNELLRKLEKNKIITPIYPSVHPIRTLSARKEKVVLMVTAWKKGKNPEYIFELFSKIPNITIIMVGRWLENDYKKTFESDVKKKKLERNIKVVGEVSEKELSSYYAKSLVLLQTNDDKGFGMPALEAAGHGTTFIIPAGQGVCNLFKNKVDGFFTKEKDTNDIVKKIELLLHDRSHAIKMGKHAWSTVMQNYSWEKHAEKLREVAQEYAA